MAVLVIGGTRFVGYQLVWRLLASGYRITLLNRGSHPDPFGERVERLKADRTGPDFRRVLAGRSFDATIDFAGYTGADVRGVIDSLGTERAGHYIFISSGQVYLVLEGNRRPAREQDYPGTVMADPADPVDHRNWLYGVGKREAEDVLEKARLEDGFRSTRLRIPMVNGERDYSGRLESYVWRILDGGPVLLPDAGTHMTRHVYAGAVARVICDLLGNPATFGQAFNLCQDETPTLADLVTILAESLGAPPRLAAVPAEDIRAAGLDPAEISPFSGRWMSFLDPSRAKLELDFRHEPLRVYLDRILTCFLNHPPPQPPSNYMHRQTELALAS
jgi:nucleoside-diphosphate-sugar epimerase